MSDLASYTARRVDDNSRQPLSSLAFFGWGRLVDDPVHIATLASFFFFGHANLFVDFRTCFRFRLWLWIWLGRPEPIPSLAFRMLRIRLALHLSAHNSIDGQQKRNRERNHTRKRSSPQITLLIAVIESAPHIPSLAHPIVKLYLARSGVCQELHAPRKTTS